MFFVIISILKHVPMQRYLSIKLHELIFLGCHSQFTSYPHTFALYSYSCKILQPYVAVTVRMHSDAVSSSTDALLMKTVIENNRQ